MLSLKSLTKFKNKIDKEWYILNDNYEYHLKLEKKHYKKYIELYKIRDKIQNKYINENGKKFKIANNDENIEILDKLDKEIDLSRAEWRIHADKSDEYNEKSGNLNQFLRNVLVENNSKLVKITKTKEKKLEKEICGICCDNHKIKSIVTTCCGHTFGKCCFEKLLNYNLDNDVEISCPMCRKSNIEIIRYSDKKIKIRSTT